MEERKGTVIKERNKESINEKMKNVKENNKRMEERNTEKKERIIGRKIKKYKK